MNAKTIAWLLLVLSGGGFGIYLMRPQAAPSDARTIEVVRRTVRVEVKTVGELEASRSISIASSIKGDQGKIIDLIPEGIYVQPGELLVQLDASPFEQKLEKLEAQIKEQEAYIASLKHTLTWEKQQAEHKNRMTLFELEAAQLELDKVLHGDGPQEILRLKALMQKARLKYDELQAYAHELEELEGAGWLNAAEVRQAQKKLEEEREAYEMATQQYDSYVNRIYPMLIKKAETQLKKAQITQEETAKSGCYTVAKTAALLNQAKQMRRDYALQRREAQNERNATEIRAPAPGMVVHREDYRSGQRRKPRIGDVVINNQPLIDLPDLASLFVKTRVREVDLFKVEIGKKAVITVDAYPQLVFQGTVSAIGVLALCDAGRAHDEKYFEVHIALDQSDQRLRPGMTTRVAIQAAEAVHALTVPLYTLFEEDAHTCCYVKGPHGIEKRMVTPGIHHAQWAEIKAGLEEGEQVCLTYSRDL